jgi:hypothetical protein
MYGNYEGFHKCHTQCQPPPVAEIIAPIGHSIHEERCFHVIVGSIPNGRNMKSSSRIGCPKVYERSIFRKVQQLRVFLYTLIAINAFLP